MVFWFRNPSYVVDITMSVAYLIPMGILCVQLFRRQNLKQMSQTASLHKLKLRTAISFYQQSKELN